MSEEITKETTVETKEVETKPEQEQPSQKEPKNVEKENDDKVSIKELEKAQARIAELNKENEKRRHENKAWGEFEKDGYDPEKIQALIKQQKDADRKRLEDEGKYQEIIAEMEQERDSKINEALSKKDEEVTNLRNTLEKYFVDNAITSALNKEKASEKLLGRTIRDQVKFIEENGEYKTVVVDKDGNTRTKRGGAPYTVDDLVQDMKGDEEYARAFPAPSTSGSGTTPNASTSSTQAAPKAIRSKMTLNEKVAYQQKYGKEAYDALPLH